MPATRCFSPTSATNVRSMHTRSVRFPSVGLSPPPTDPARAEPSLEDPRPRTAGAVLQLGIASFRSQHRSSTAPGRCAFDDAHRASGLPFTIFAPFREKPRTAPGGAPVPRRCRPRVRLKADTSVILVAPTRGPRLGTSFVPAMPATLAPEPPLSPPRQRRAAGMATQDDFHRRVSTRMPLARLSVRTRHRYRGFATEVRLPTLVRSSDALAWSS